MITSTRTRRTFETRCTIEIEHSADHLHAHVELAGDVRMMPGDKVLVHGEPIQVPFGERRVLHRHATVARASALGRWWTKVSSALLLTELYEVSFTPRRRL